MLADAGVAARRVCERLIEEGHVTVNGQVVATLPAFVDPEHDRIAVDGRPIKKPERRVYLMLHKPARVLTVAADEPGADRRTVLDLVQHPGASRLFPIGRLDYDATGLVLLTNDGELANRLSHPRYEIPKTYHVVVKGSMADELLPKLAKELAKAERHADRIEGRVRPAAAVHGIDFRIASREAGRTLLEITLRSGPMKRVEATLAAAGHPPKKVERIGLGPLRLRGLAVGQWRELERDELQALRRAARGSAPKAAQPPKPRPRRAAPSGGRAGAQRGPQRRRGGRA